MDRRHFAKTASALALGATLPTPPFSTEHPPVADDRAYWINVATRIATPVLEALSQDQLKARMPVETRPGREEALRKVTHLEAFGRLMAGLAPWLELGPGPDEEGQLRAHFIDQYTRALSHAVNPQSADYMTFYGQAQALVDAAFLAHALLRAPSQLWEKLGQTDQDNLVKALQSTRTITPYYNNWLLFSAMVEAALLRFTGEWDQMRVDYAVKTHLNWYKGDGHYGDGPDFHWDYYNSYVIQPMLLDILALAQEKGVRNGDQYELVLERARRYAAIQERLISPEGTFPPIGRSLPYRFGAFQLLAQIALMNQLPEPVSKAQVRSALTAVIRRMTEANGTFDEAGWLRIGFYGHQPDIAESYLSTGSLYLCSVGLLPLGLSPEDAFWSDPPADWTAKRIWNGENLPADKALK